MRFVEKRCAYENAGNGTAEPGETDDDEDLERGAACWLTKRRSALFRSDQRGVPLSRPFHFTS